MSPRRWGVGREWNLPAPTFEGEHTIDDEDDAPILDEDDTEILSEGP